MVRRKQLRRLNVNIIISTDRRPLGRESSCTVFAKQIMILSLHAPERISLLNWALRYKWHAIIVLCTSLPDTVPVNCNLHAFHVILNVDNNSIIFADLNTWPWNHTIDRQNTTFNTIG